MEDDPHGDAQHVERSRHLEEYSASRPPSAGAKPRSLLNKVAAATGVTEEDDEWEKRCTDGEWLLDGWGDEPSVPDTARQASGKLSKYLRSVPNALPAPNGAGRRVVSAGPTLQAKPRLRSAESRKQRPAAPQTAPVSVGRSAIPPGPSSQPSRRQALRSLDVGDESDVEPEEERSAPHRPSAGSILSRLNGPVISATVSGGAAAPSSPPPPPSTSSHAAAASAAYAASPSSPHGAHPLAAAAQAAVAAGALQFQYGQQYQLLGGDGYSPTAVRMSGSSSLQRQSGRHGSQPVMLYAAASPYSVGVGDLSISGTGSKPCSPMGGSSSGRGAAGGGSSSARRVSDMAAFADAGLGGWDTSPTSSRPETPVNMVAAVAPQSSAAAAVASAGGRPAASYLQQVAATQSSRPRAAMPLLPSGLVPSPQPTAVGATTTSGRRLQPPAAADHTHNSDLHTLDDILDANRSHEAPSAVKDTGGLRNPSPRFRRLSLTPGTDFSAGPIGVIGTGTRITGSSPHRQLQPSPSTAGGALSIDPPDMKPRLGAAATTSPFVLRRAASGSDRTVPIANDGSPGTAAANRHLTDVSPSAAQAARIDGLGPASASPVRRPQRTNAAMTRPPHTAAAATAAVAKT